MTDRQFQEIVARCVSTMVYHHNCERSHRNDAQLIAEVQDIAGSVKEEVTDATEVTARIVRPVDAELTARYGPEAGTRLFQRFIEAFDGLRASHAPRRQAGQRAARDVSRCPEPVRAGTPA